MILSYKPKIIFVHIPKTAGTSFSVGLKPLLKGKVITGSQQNPDWKHHVRAIDFKNKLPDYDEFFKFTIVRNPYDRLYSWCSMLKNKQFGNEPISKEAFKGWLLYGGKYLRNIPQKQNQWIWIADNQDNILVDYIGKFESVEAHWNEIVKKIGGKKMEMPKRRTSVRLKDYREMYDDEMIEFVQTYHKKDLDYFNYSF